MKVKCVIDCTGLGYKNFNVGEERELEKELAEKLISFGYVKELQDKPKTKKTKE